MADEIDFENGRICNVQRHVTLTLTLDRPSLIDLYLHAKFHLNQTNFLWTDGRTYVRTDGQTDRHRGRLYQVDSEKST